MNDISSAASTHHTLSRSSSRTRSSNLHNQSSRTPPQALPAIDTAVASTYSHSFQPSSRSQPKPQHGFQVRQVSAGSVASVSSSSINTSLFSQPRETPTTITSNGSILASIPTPSSCYGEEGENEHDTKSTHTHDHTTVRAYGNARSQDSQRPLSPAQSFDSIADQSHTHVLALHDFTPIAPNATCLSFRAGQIIQVVNRDASGWWDGELDGRRGWFPSNYVSGLDQVGRLRDEVLVELHKTNRHESTPSLASWTSGLSFTNDAGQTSTQTPMMPTFETHSDQLLSELPPEFSSPDLHASYSRPTLRNNESSSSNTKLSDFPGNDNPTTDRAGALSPTFSLYQAIAEGDVSSCRISPTPSLSTSHHNNSPRLTPLLLALSLLHRAVVSRRQRHYQPSTACVISCVRSLLTLTECIDRDAPTLRRVPQLAQERKIILGNLATLVAQARRCSEWPGVDSDGDGVWNETSLGQAEIEQQDWELEQMLRMGGEVLRNVTQFLDVCEANDVELPITRGHFSHVSGSGSSGSERDMRQKVKTDLGVANPATTRHRRAQPGSTPLQRRGAGSDGAQEATIKHVPCAVRPLDKPVELSALRTKSLNDLRERRRMQHLEHSKQIHNVPVPTHPAVRSVAQRQIRPKQLSISSMSSLSSGSVESYGSPILSPPFPSGPCGPAQVLSALRKIHDDLLSSIAAFIGHAHSYGRHSHASSMGHLIELARETVDMVKKLLTLVEAVARHPDVGATKAEGLQEAKDALFASTNELVEAVRETTSPTASEVSEEDERRRMLHGATGVLKVAADCVNAVKMCLSRPIGEEPFIICLPSSSSDRPSLLGTPQVAGKRPRAVSYLRRRSISVTSMQDHEALGLPQHVIGVVTEDGETHAEDDMTIQPVHVPLKPAVDSPMREASSRGSESTAEEDSEEEELPDNRSRRSFAAEAEPGREGLDSSERKEGYSLYEKKLLHGSLPVPPSDSNAPPSPSTPSNSVHPPLDVNSVFANILTHDYDVRDIAYNAEGVMVGATLDVLVEKMTPHDALVDPAFHQIFMMTWRLFMSPSELVSALTERYNLRAPAVLNNSELEVWVKRKATPVRLRVFNFIKTWLEAYWRPDTDDSVLTQLSQFIRDTIALQFPAAAQRILEIIRARTISDNSIVSPRPINQTKSADRLRETPASLPSPVSPSDMPRSSINKTLFAALKNKAYSNIAITDFDALELARQFTIMESKLYLLVKPEDLLETGGTLAINVKAISTLSTAITGWITESILDESDTKKRTNLVKFFIKVADRCLGLNNYSTSRSILAALDSSTISRLHQTWMAIPHKSKVQLEAQRKLADRERNFSVYRSRLRNTNPPAVPFLGVCLSDVTFCREGNHSHRNAPSDPNRKLINFCRYHKLAKIVQDIQRHQVPYNLKEIPEVQSYLTVQFDDSKKKAGDLQDLYRRSLRVEPRQPADTPISSSDGKPLLQIWGLATLSRSQTLIPVPKPAQS